MVWTPAPGHNSTSLDAAGVISVRGHSANRRLGEITSLDVA
jgi:hypothetical protein